MELNNKTRLKDLFVYLRREFGVEIYSSDNKGLASLNTQLFKMVATKKTKKSGSFIISKNSTIGEVHLLLESYADLNIEFRNERGIKLSFDVKLNDAKCLMMSPSANTRLISTALNSSISIAKDQVLNADFDWVYRILKKTAYKLKTDDEKLLMAKTIVEICENSPDISVAVLCSITDIFCVNDIDRLAISKEMSYSKSQKVTEFLAIFEDTFNIS